MKPIVSLAAVGFLGVLIVKVMLGLVAPLIGLVALVIKIALIVALVWGGILLFRKLTEKPSEA